MRVVTVVQLRENLARWLRLAERGERIEIRRHDEAIATLGPRDRDEAGAPAPIAAEPVAGATATLLPPGGATRRLSTAARLALFDAASARQAERERAAPREPSAVRGWAREELYDRDRPR